MALPCNEARGERSVAVNGVDLVVVADYERIAFLSAELGCKSWRDLVERVSEAEPATMYAVLAHCVIRGDAAAARKALKPRGAFALAGAMTGALAHTLDEEKPAKNAGGAGEIN